ncbi:MAG: isoprenylcysteine carboxylmethyltransferase family protein [Myxococcota bacterium]|nr:isoprenylcysteine carboxylmethyltransferase family protein [Myxococcota bacterium]
MVCHLVFVCAISTQFLMMYGGMTQGQGTATGSTRWFFNLALVLQFPLVHSFLLTRPGQRVLARLAPPGLGKRLWSTTFVTIAAAQILLLFLMWSPSGTVLWSTTGGLRWCLSLFYVGSWLLLFKAMKDAGLAYHSGVIGWRAVYRNERPQYPGMPTAGLFAYCRQPIYVAFALTTWTVPTWTTDQLAIALILTTYCVVAPLHKERRSRRLFGQAFEDYAQRVPYWIPRRPKASQQRTPHGE